MTDKDKTKEELTDELKALHKRIKQLEKSEIGHSRSKEIQLESEEKYKLLIEMTNTGYVILDGQGRVIDANQEYVRLTGRLRLEEILGKNVVEWTAKHDLERNAGEVRKCFELGFVRNLEIDYVDKEGKIVPVEINATVLRTSEADRILTVCRDITGRKKAEEDLKRSLSLLQATLESTADGILVVDATGEIAGFNERFAQLWRLPEDILSSRDDKKALIFSMDQLKDPEEFIDKVRKLYAQPRAESFDLLEFKDGRVFERYSQPQMIDGRPVGRVWSFRDVTGRKRMERAVMESESILRAAFDNTPFEFWVRDTDGRCIMENVAAAENWGSSLGLKPEDTGVSKETLAIWQDNNMRALAGEVVRDEVEYDRNGQTRYYYNILAPIRVGDEIRGIVGFNIDITELKRSEEALNKAHKLDQILMDSLPYPAMLIQYPERVILNLNRSAKEAGAVIGGICHRDFGKDVYVATGTNQCSFCRADEMFEKQETIIADELFAYDTWWSVYWIPVTDNIYLHFRRDITDRKKSEADRERLEEQLRRAQKMEAIGLLAGGVAHDFNNILTAIIGYGGLAQTNVKDDLTTRGYMQQVLDAADRAGYLTKSLLAFSRKQVIEPVLADINEIVRNIEKMLRRIMREDITLSTVLSDGEIPVIVDVGQIEQVLMNLAVNARDAMPRGGQLVIRTDVVNADSRGTEEQLFENTVMYAVLTVSDTGVGMDHKTRENIFEPFFTTKEMGKGTGLGLSMVYGIIKQHDGNINVYSEVGKGTTFKIDLPLAQTKIETISDSIEPLPGGKGETIIIAEDELQVRESMRLLLEAAGYKIIEAENGEEAVRKFKNNRGAVSLVLLDVIMPAKNGREVYEEIKGIEPGIRTIFMSGYTDDIIAKNGMLEEGFDFISKPIHPDTLMRKIREVLDR